MFEQAFSCVHPFVSDVQGHVIRIQCLTPENFPEWLEAQAECARTAAREAGFGARTGQILILRGAEGTCCGIWAGVSPEIKIFEIAQIATQIQKSFSPESLESRIFSLENLPGDEASHTRSALGWALASYTFSAYKTEDRPRPVPRLLPPAQADMPRVRALNEGITIARTLINIPANDLSPEGLEHAARHLARLHGAEIHVTVDDALLSANFPLIYAVGDSSPRRPRLIDLRKGDPAWPRISLVGKGVVFDTGGLDIKPPQAMLLMKKDMAGAAHVLGLAHILMSLDLPICLRVLIPAVENATSGRAFRPKDVFRSRRGLSVETDDTDAEGRLIVADCLTCAGEENPDLLVDFTTLTGAARVALGYDLPAFFGNREATVAQLKELSMTHEDPLWPLPIWEPYRAELSSDIADICNIGTGRAGAIHGALFLDRFFDPAIDWVHIDMYGWEQQGRAGKPKGGTDMGLRAVLALIEARYGTSRP